MDAQAAISLKQLKLGRKARGVRDFCAWLQTTMPDQVERLILYGSYARRAAHSKSDIDLLLALRNLTREQEEAIARKINELEEKNHIDLSVITYSHAELAHWLTLGTPFICNVADDGIALLGDKLVVKQTLSKAVVDGFMQSARQRLRAATVLLEADEPRAAISQAFYAFLDAADAALVARGIRTKSHAGTIDLFNQHFIKTGLVEAQYSEWFKRIRKDRLEADYERMRVFTEAEGRLALERATQFVDVVETLLSTLAADAQDNQ
jgi:uncharacterized protein (UPF0332 family)/predicted nucleotidyltransferase